MATTGNSPSWTIVCSACGIVDKSHHLPTAEFLASSHRSYIVLEILKGHEGAVVKIMPTSEVPKSLYAQQIFNKIFIVIFAIVILAFTAFVFGGLFPTGYR